LGNVVSPDALFWTKWSAIGQIAGAVGTFAAVLTSLWLAVRSSRPRIEISCGIRLVIEAGTQAPFPEVIQFDIRNVGQQDAHVEQIGWRTGRWRWARPAWLQRQQAIQLFGTVPGAANPPFVVPVGQRRSALLNLPQTLENILHRAGDEPFFARNWPVLGMRKTTILAVVFLANGQRAQHRVEPDLERRLLIGEREKSAQAARNQGNKEG
jgi:hypothetical protein